MATKTLFAAALVGIAALASPALADDDNCRYVPRAEWRSMEDAIAAVKAEGFEVREIDSDDGCYEVKAKGPSGERMKIYLDPSSLEIVRRKDRS